VGTAAGAAALWNDGVLSDLAVAQGRSSAAYAINERREIVGAADFDGTGDSRGFVLSCGRVRDLGTLGGRTSGAYDLNERGQVIGVSEDAAGTRVVFLEQAGVMTPLFPSSQEGGLAINERGEIVNGEYLWTDGALFELKVLVAHESCWLRLYGNDINDDGDIVGWGRACEDPGAMAPAVVITQHPERYRAYTDY
jgi:probable HAF family extracellular repeat protein